MVQGERILIKVSFTYDIPAEMSTFSNIYF